MKKTLWLLSAVALLLFCGCSKKENSRSTEAPAAPAQTQASNDTAQIDENSYTDTVSEEADVSDEAKPLPEFPGSEDNFVFQMQGNYYEFQATDSTKLLYWRSDYIKPDRQGYIELVVSCEGAPSRMFNMSEYSFEESKSEYETVYEGVNGTVYQHTVSDDNDIYHHYYFTSGNFIFELYDADDLINEGIDPQTVFETADAAMGSIKETNAENPLSTAEGQLIKEAAFDDYRFAFRPSSCYDYLAKFSINSGNSAFTEGGLSEMSMQIQMKDENGNDLYTAKMDFDPAASPSLSGNAENTGVNFAGYEIYLDTESMRSGQNYILLLGKEQVRTTLHADDERFTPEQAQEALSIIFEKM